MNIYLIILIFSYFINNTFSSVNFILPLTPNSTICHTSVIPLCQINITNSFNRVNPINVICIASERFNIHNVFSLTVSGDGLYSNLNTGCTYNSTLNTHYEIAIVLRGGKQYRSIYIL